MTKSKKIQTVIVDTFGNVLRAQRPNGRICSAWREEDGTFILQAQTEGMPADYKETHETVEDLEKSMRDFADLRHWVPDPYYFD